MAVFPSEDRLRMKRQRSEKAIQLAMQNRWQEAADINRQILETFPEDVDTLNRLGKAQMEPRALLWGVGLLLYSGVVVLVLWRRGAWRTDRGRA